MLFPGRTLDEAMRALEELRASIESYRMKVRSDDRPQDSQSGSQRRAPATATLASPDKVLSVTVSIGAAERRDMQNPSEVLRSADQALYRAKLAGRNRVSR